MAISLLSTRRSTPRDHAAEGSPGPARRGDPPAARRQRRAAWRDLRLWAGLALVAVATALGARVLGASSDTVEVWQAARDLPAQEPLAPGDVVAVRVPRAVAAYGYLAAGVPVEGTVVRPVAAGELLPVRAVVANGLRPGREVTVPVDEGHFPVGLAVGQRVDAWVSEARADATGAPPRQVLVGARVAAVSTDGFGLGGQVAVVLEVPDDEVAGMVAAVRGGVVDLVSVPLQASAGTP